MFNNCEIQIDNWETQIDSNGNNYMINTLTKQKIPFQEWLELAVNKGYFTKEERDEDVFIKVKEGLYKKENRKCTVYKTN